MNASTRTTTPPSEHQSTVQSSPRSSHTRLWGIFIINASVWFMVGAVDAAGVKAVIVTLGSLVAMASGCISWWWKSQVDVVTSESEAIAALQVKQINKVSHVPPS